VHALRLARQSKPNARVYVIRRERSPFWQMLAKEGCRRIGMKSCRTKDRKVAEAMAAAWQKALRSEGGKDEIASTCIRAIMGVCDLELVEELAEWLERKQRDAEAIHVARRQLREVRRFVETGNPAALRSLVEESRRAKTSQTS